MLINSHIYELESNFGSLVVKVDEWHHSFELGGVPVVTDVYSGNDLIVVGDDK